MAMKTQAVLAFGVFALLAASTVRTDAQTASGGAVVKAYVSNSNSDSVTVVDVATMAPVGDPILVGDDPRGLSATPDGSRVYVVNRQGSVFVETGMPSQLPSVTVIDTRTDTVVTTIRLTPFQPYDIVVSPTAPRAYVSCTGDDAVSVIDTTTNLEIQVVDLAGDGVQGEGIAITPDGSKVYVADRGNASVQVIRTSDHTLVGSPIVLNSSPRSVFVTPDGEHVWVVGDGVPAVIDVATDTLVPTTLEDIGSQRDVVCVGDRVYVTNTSYNPQVADAKEAVAQPGQASVDVYDASLLTLVESIAVALGQAYGLDVTPDGACAVVTHKGSAALGSVDLEASDENPSTAAVGDTPRRVVLAEVVDEKPVVSYFLPKIVKAKVRGAGQDSLSSTGFYDDGGSPVDYGQPVTLEIGGFTRTFTMVAKGKGFASPKDKTFSFQVVPNLKGSSRGKFKLKLKKGTLGGLLPQDGEVELHFRATGLPDAFGKIVLSDARYQLGRARGALLDPPFFPARSVAVLKEGANDKLQFKGGFATGGVTPATISSVRIAFGDGFQRTIPGTSFTKAGDRFLYLEKDGAYALVIKIDFLRETVLTKAKGIELGDLETATIDVVFGSGETSQSVRLTVTLGQKGSKRFY